MTKLRKGHPVMVTLLIGLLLAALSAIAPARAGGGMPAMNSRVVWNLNLGGLESNQPVVRSRFTSNPAMHFDVLVRYVGYSEEERHGLYVNAFGVNDLYDGAIESVRRPGAIGIKPTGSDGRNLFNINWDAAVCALGPQLRLVRYAPKGNIHVLLTNNTTKRWKVSMHYMDDPGRQSSLPLEAGGSMGISVPNNREMYAEVTDNGLICEIIYANPHALPHP